MSFYLLLIIFAFLKSTIAIELAATPPRNGEETMVHIASKNLVNGHLIGWSGENMKLQCMHDVQRSDWRVERINWMAHFRSVQNRAYLNVTNISHIFVPMNYDSIELVQLGKPMKVHVYCVVQKYGEYYSYNASHSVPLLILPRLNASISPQSKPGFVTGFTGQSLKIKCLVKDTMTKRKVDAEIQWYHRVTSRNKTRQSPPQPTPNDFPWSALRPSGRNMLVEGLRPQRYWRGEIACQTFDQASGENINSSWVEVQQDHTSATLSSVLAQACLADTTIITDQWSGYNSIVNIPGEISPFDGQSHH